ncbi:MAG: hypothetical protein ACFCUV_13175 [Rivularia sp. (in: cyanobacteria)]
MPTQYNRDAPGCSLSEAFKSNRSNKVFHRIIVSGSLITIMGRENGNMIASLSPDEFLAFNTRYHLF